MERLTIWNTETNNGIEVMYNPEQFSLEEGNQFSEIGIPGRMAPPIQYVRGKSRTLSTELFFDTYAPAVGSPAAGQGGTKKDVREFTVPIVDLLKQSAATHAPPILLLTLGRGVSFQCVLVDAGQRFTMFTADGTPVRATITVRFQEYVPFVVGTQTMSGPPGQTSPATMAPQAGGAGSSLTTHTVVNGETLSGIASLYYGDPALWRTIADANGVANPRKLQIGTVLNIPPKGT